ncbi:MULTISPECIES: NAD(P)-binding protein [Bradyrhizobium]|uniref:NAD(P)-binding protein n=1 Tax=Bradyrhizobium TaxID=374 RepID=UPI001B8A2886|nr:MULTISPECIES: FAD/NAD(P)-binding protein [Bradyrhizobium]MBR0973212.1 NAD(P)/FAD-dependent oxidoreductase [Bradyrhizobium japonicum]
MLTTDYLIIGSGAAGMSFADQLLTETNASIVIVDRHHLPGGHWNDAYSFVRLHAPSAFYGVGSRRLGNDCIDVSGLNRGYYELASGAEIVSYFDKLMQERFLPSGRVQYFPMCEYLGHGRFISRLSGTMQQVAFGKRLVNATFQDTQVPSTHTPSFQVAEGVELTTPNLLPMYAPGHERRVILGGGKTAMDVCIWLQQMGARPESIRWIVPQDSWVRNRDMMQPGDAFFERTVGGTADLFEAAAEATSVADLFERLEKRGQILRIDRTIWPTAFRGATLSILEAEALGTIKDVVRKGRVRRIERDSIVLDRGNVDAAPDDLYVDCTAKGFRKRPAVPIFNADQITLQQVRPGRLSFSAAFIAHVEASYNDDAIKNDLCAPIPSVEVAEDFLSTMIATLRNERRWTTEKELRRWIDEHRLSGTGFPDTGVASSPKGTRILERLREARPRAAANLARIIAELDSTHQAS